MRAKSLGVRAKPFGGRAKSLGVRAKSFGVRAKSFGGRAKSFGGRAKSFGGRALKLELSGGQSFVRWSWQGKSAFLDLLELHVDRGSGFALLAMDTTPNYLDTTPAPATPQKWTYKAIFRIGDQRVGQWSDEVSIIIGG